MTQAGTSVLPTPLTLGLVALELSVSTPAVRWAGTRPTGMPPKGYRLATAQERKTTHCLLPASEVDGESHLQALRNADLVLAPGARCVGVPLPFLTGVIVPANLGALSAPGNCHCILMCGESAAIQIMKNYTQNNGWGQMDYQALHQSMGLLWLYLWWIVIRSGPED